jgi:putative nucleotidyltransferase with HDIG domain
MQITSLDQAVLMLGHRPLLRLVVASAFGNTLSHPLPGYAVEASELWRHSLITALAAELLAGSAQLPGLEPAIAFTGGLLHDFGKLVFNQVLTPPLQAKIRERIEHEGLSRIQAEKDVMQTDHAEVGAALLAEWQLPEIIVEAVARHHDPVCRPRVQLSALVHVANCLAHLIGSAPGWEGYALHSCGDAASAVGIGSDDIEALVIRVQDSVQQVEQLIEAA